MIVLLQKAITKRSICSSCDHLNVHIFTDVSCLTVIEFTTIITKQGLWTPAIFILIQFEMNSWTKTFGSFLSSDNSSCTESGELIYSIMCRYQTFVSNSCKSTATVWLKSVASGSPTAGFGGVFLYNAQVSQLLTTFLSISNSPESLTPAFTKSLCSLSAVACPNCWWILISSFLCLSLSLNSITWSTSDPRVSCSAHNCVWNGMSKSWVLETWLAKTCDSLSLLNKLTQ